MCWRSTMADAPLRAIAIIEGWVSQMGPCYPFEDHADAHDRIASIAHEQAFDEIPSRSELQNAWQRAFARWCKLRRELTKSVLEKQD